MIPRNVRVTERKGEKRNEEKNEIMHGHGKKDANKPNRIATNMETIRVLCSAFKILVIGIFELVYNDLILCLCECVFFL